MIGQILGHYRILDKIGAGGMGVVYRAHDEHLGREVAIKVLPAGLLADEAARKRFRKEAEALSKLNHPHIAVVHDFDTQDGTDFLVMELIPGETLSDRLAGGALPEKEMLRLGAQLAEGLAAAHAEGIVHCDLKSANLRITLDGRLKILDFGLARLVRPESDEGLTASLTDSTAMTGTLPYMAPEQLRGEQVDARTDLYAAGVVLYEMATGQRPFREPLAPRMMDAILHRAPAPPSGLNRSIAAELERIILKCLEKDPGNRYQSARELGVDFRRLATPQTGGVTPRAKPRARGRMRSLAVLPLDNLSRDPEQEYFADGMTEALITGLAKFGTLKVISRTTVMRYKGTSKRLPEIAAELGVDGILEGSVMRAGERVRITAQLVHAATDVHLWAESYDRDVRDVLALQSDVAHAIAQEIQIKLKPHERTRLKMARRVNPEAHDAMLKGRFHWYKWTREGFEKAVEYFQQAIGIDPEYAPAYAGLADALIFLAYWYYAAFQEVYPKAKAAALRAVELDDSLAEAHAALGALHWFYDWDLSTAEREFRRALALNPNDPAARIYYAVFLAVIRDDFEGAFAQAKVSQERDPFSLFVNVNIGWLLSWSHQPEKAIAQAYKTLDLDPKCMQAYYILSHTFLWMSRFEEAIKISEKAVQISPDVASFGFLATSYAAAGQTDRLQTLLSMLQEKAPQRSGAALNAAMFHLLVGEKEQAIEALEKAYEQHDARLFWLRFFPGLGVLRDDPRYQALLRRVRLPK